MGPGAEAAITRAIAETVPTWLEDVAWEPMLRVAARSLGGRAAWLRVGETFRLTVVDGPVSSAVEAWLERVSRRAADIDFLDDRSGDARAVGVPVVRQLGVAPGSLGVMAAADADLLDVAAREILTDLASALRSGMALAMDATASAQAVDTLSILAKAVANMQLGVTITDSQGRIVFTNPAEARMHGYEPGELIGQPAHILAPPSLRRDLYMEAERSDTSWTRESVNLRRDGSEFPVLLWSDVIADGDGGFRGVVTCGEDLTERREVEAALRRSESMFRAIFENAPVGLALLGDDTWIVRANPRLRTMLQLDAAAMEARLIDFVHPDDAETARRFYSRALGDPVEVSRFEHRIGRDRESVHWVHATISPIVGPTGRGQLWIALIEDMTRRRALEEQLRHSQKMEAVGRLAGGVAHDFNNLLTAIRGIAELLLLESGEEHPMAEDIREIHRAADTAADLTRQLLAFSRRQVTQYHLQNLNVIVGDAENMLRRLTGEDVELVVDTDPDIAPILGDQSQIEQVLLNLVVNARDATSPGGRVRLSTRNVRVPPRGEEDEVQGGRYVELAVEDTGHGIDPGTLRQIFDPFFTTKPQGRGTGLGLSTVYGIVKQAGGHIWVDSDVGEGSTFRVWFPVADPTTDLLSEAMFGPIRTIMVVHEEETRRTLAAELLEESGYRVLTPASVDEAKELAETYGDRIHLLLIDAGVGGRTGVPIAAGMVELREDMKVIVLDGGVGPSAIAGHGFRTLDREIRPEKLLETIRRELDEGRC